MSNFVASLVAPEIGPAFIGAVFCLTLYGTTLAQTVFYLRSFPDDSRERKSLVCFLCVVDTFHIYLVIHAFWYILISGPSVGISLLLTIPWQLMGTFIVAVFTVTVVQIFFGWKVWSVSGKNRIIISIIGLFGLGQFIAGMAFSGHLIIAKSPTFAFNREGSLYGRMQLCCGLVCDLTISGSLVYYFYIFRSRIDRSIDTRRSKNVLQYLIVLSINMGVLLCLLTALTLILFQVRPGTFISFGPNLAISKLYVNSLLATLNSRKHFRDMNSRPIAGNSDPTT